MNKLSFLGASFGLAAAALVTVAQAAPEKPPGQAAASCTTEQLTVIDAAYTLAQTRIAEGIAFLDANPNHAHTRRFFGDAPRKMVRLSLSQTQAALPAANRVTPRCNTEGCNGAYAFTQHDATWINFCPTFFQRSPTEGRDARYGVVIHETSHVVAHTRDAAYFPEGTEELTKEHPEITPMNAESLELFVELMPR
jgi:hypothetical protein